jgi:hypothetical protein
VRPNANQVFELAILLCPTIGTKKHDSYASYPFHMMFLEGVPIRIQL